MKCSLNMNSDLIAMNEKISIQKILFTKAMPNYKIPIPTDGYKVFACTDCGDRFLFESSLMVHINRKSFIIQYFCRYCGISNVFINRCQFLSHIRSHAIKTATINLNDIKVEPLPLVSSGIGNSQQNLINDDQKTKFNCFECKINIDITESIEKDRALHYMQTTKIVTCPVCLFTLPSTCALIAHLRIHLITPPFICCECGKYLSLQTCIYPYGHDCEGFKMMRVTSKLKCFDETCPAIHSNNYVAHLKLCHLNKIYKCPNCYLAGYNENAVMKHVIRCCNKSKYPTYFECQKCPGIFLNSSQINKHLEKHFLGIRKSHDSQLFPCWKCGLILYNVYDFLNHHVSKRYCNATHKILVNIMKKVKYEICGSCQKTFWYWQENQERANKCFRCILNETPHSAILVESSSQHDKDLKIKCHLCKTEISENWTDIKKHFIKFHKSFKCLDLKLVLRKLNLKDIKQNKIVSQQSNSTSNQIARHFKQKKRLAKIKFPIEKLSTAVIKNINASQCPKCNYNADDRVLFESHLKTHRDPDMAYQCMECGICIAVKPSFATHLLLEHKICDVEDYIKIKDCYNKLALEKIQKVIPEENLPLEKNQCNVCRDKFSDSNTLEKHYRIHGMAFLIKNNQKSKGSIQIN